MPKLSPLNNEDNAPQEIWYADMPPRMGGVGRKISVEAFQKIYGKPFQYTETIWFPNSFNLKLQQNCQDVLGEALSCLKQPKTNKLLLCNMGEVGYGLFAREKIHALELVGVYAGEAYRSSSQESREYSFDYVLDRKNPSGSEYGVDAEKKGGLLRFAQHLPHHDISILRAQRALRSNRALFTKDLLLEGCTDRNMIEQLYAHHSISRATEAQELAAYQDFNKEKASQGQDQHWHLNNTEFFSPYSFNDVESSNLKPITIEIKGLPILLFFASRDIEIGEQIGFDYGSGYWGGREMLPRLFNKAGRAISEEFYRYQQMYFSRKLPARPQFSLPEENRGNFFTKTQFFAGIETQLPLQIVKTALPFSIFHIRNKLTENNVLPASYKKLRHNTFAQQLDKLWTKWGGEISLYYHNPEERKNTTGLFSQENYAVDVVCKSPTTLKWFQLADLVKTSAIAEHCKCYAISKEVIIRGVNIHSKLMQDFIEKLSEMDLKTYFETVPQDAPEEVSDDALVMSYGGGFRVMNV